MYDMLNWAYLKVVLCVFGFAGNGIKWVMSFVEFAFFSTLSNGAHGKPFKPNRGFRHGGFLSLYLFIICAKSLAGRV